MKVASVSIMEVPCGTVSNPPRDSPWGMEMTAMPSGFPVWRQDYSVMALPSAEILI